MSKKRKKKQEDQPKVMDEPVATDEQAESETVTVPAEVTFVPDEVPGFDRDAATKESAEAYEEACKLHEQIWSPQGSVEYKNPMANADWIEDWAKDNQRIATWHVMAAGPSIQEHCLKVDWRGRPAICCNGVPLLARGIDNWISVDEPRDALASWANSDVTTNKFINHAVEADFKRIVFKHWNRVGPNRDPFKYGLFWHGSVAMAAVDLARVLGARQVILWGLDYVDRSHAYDELFPDMVSKGLPQWDLEKINNRWKDMAHELKYQGGPEILNANPNSRLKVLPFIDPKKALEMM